MLDKYTEIGDLSTLQRQWEKQFIVPPQYGVTVQDIVDLQETPARVNANGDYIDPEDEDEADYRAKARQYATPTSTEKRKDALWRLDVYLGRALTRHLKGTDLSSYTDEPGDYGRYTCIMTRLLKEFPPDDTAEDYEIKIRARIIGTADGISGNILPGLITVNERLSSKLQWSDYHNKVRSELREHRQVAPDGNANHISDATVVKQVYRKAKAMHRYSGQNTLLEEVKDAGNLDIACKILSAWDRQACNQAHVAEAENDAFMAATGTEHSLDARAQKYYHVNLTQRSIDRRGKTFSAFGKSGCYNCGSERHRFAECTTAPGPHMFTAGGDKKTPRICRHFSREAGSCRLKDECNFLHIASPAREDRKQTTKPKSGKANASGGRRSTGGGGSGGGGGAAKPKPGFDYQYRSAGKGEKLQYRKRKTDAHTGFTTLGDDEDDDDDEDGSSSQRRRTNGNGWTGWSSSNTLGLSLTMMALVVTAFIPSINAVHIADQTIVPATFAMHTWSQPLDTCPADIGETVYHVTKTFDCTGKEQRNNFTAVNDEGASVKGGVTHVKRDFYNFRPLAMPQKIRTADGSAHEILGYGDIQLMVGTSKGNRTVMLRNIAFVPTFKTRLIAHNQLLKEGSTFISKPDSVDRKAEASWHFKNGTVVPLIKKAGLNFWHGTISNRHADDHRVTPEWQANIGHTDSISDLKQILKDKDVVGSRQKEAIVRCKIAELGEYVSTDPKHDKLLQLHRKLGHPSPKLTAKFINANYSRDDARRKFGKVTMTFCDACAEHKVTRGRQSKKKMEKEKHFGNKVFVDVSGPYPPAVGSAYKYEIAFVDSYSGYARIYPMQTCSQVFDRTRMFIIWLTTRRNALAKHLAPQADAPESFKLFWTEGEYNYNLGSRLHGDSAAYFRSQRYHQLCEKNGISVEHSAPEHQAKNGVVERFWRTIHQRAAAMRTSASLGFNTWWYSHFRATEMNNILPMERLQDFSPHEVVFKKKFDFDQMHTFGVKVFVKRPTHKKMSGQSRGRKGVYLGYNHSTKSNIVWFPANAEQKSILINTVDVLFDESDPLPRALLEGRAPMTTPNDEPFDSQETVPTDVATDDVEAEPETAKADDYVSTDDEDYIETDDEDADHVMATLQKHPSCNMAVGKSYSNAAKAFADPQYGADFRQASALEHRQLEERGVIKPMLWKDVPQGEKVFPSIETFIMKPGSDGKAKRAKARLVLDGSKMTAEDADEVSTISPKWPSIRWLIALAAGAGWLLWQLDIPVAFGQTPAKRTRYMRYPYGTAPKDEQGRRLVMKVENIYGATDSAFNFQEGLNAWMKTLGFTKNIYDPAIFKRPATANESELHCCWYVDDCLLTTEKENTAVWFCNLVKKRWEQPGTDIGFKIADFFLGTNIWQMTGRVALNSQAYINNLMKTCEEEDKLPKNMPGKNQPLKTGTKISKLDCPGTPSTTSRFRTIAAQLNWLATTTRADIAFAVHKLCSVAHDPGQVHYDALIHVLQYLKNTSALGLTYYNMNRRGHTSTPFGTIRRNELVTSADAAHWDDAETRRSTSGFVTIMNGGAIDWNSRRQRLITLSSTESEIVCCVQAVRALLWLRYFAGFQGYLPSGPSVVQQDNESAIRIMANPHVSVGTRSQHIHARFLWVAEKIASGEIVLMKTNTKDLAADALTKALSVAQFAKLVNLFMRQ